MRHALVLSVFTAFSALSAQRSSTAAIEGRWEGTIFARSIRRDMRLTISSDSGHTRGTVDLPHQYVFGYSLANVAGLAVSHIDFPPDSHHALRPLARLFQLVGASKAIGRTRSSVRLFAPALPPPRFLSG